jgi:hypothetical protein
MRSNVAGKMQLAFVDLGEQQLKNIAQPVRVYRSRVGAEWLDKTMGRSARPWDQAF